ncbi:MAG TPA: hypothetical protein V6D10_01040 [Trichocoleus sp.]|jgi:hypothetical protein
MLLKRWFKLLIVATTILAVCTRFEASGLASTEQLLPQEQLEQVNQLQLLSEVRIEQSSYAQPNIILTVEQGRKRGLGSLLTPFITLLFTLVFQLCKLVFGGWWWIPILLFLSGFIILSKSK